MEVDPARRRQAAATALWLPVSFGVGSFAIAGARAGSDRRLDRNASVRGLGVAFLATGVFAALRWRYGEPRSEVEFRKLFTAEAASPVERAVRIGARAILYGTASVMFTWGALAVGALASTRARSAVPDFEPRRLPVAFFEGSLLMGGAIVAVTELMHAIRAEAVEQPRIARAHEIELPPEPAIIAPGTAEEAFGDLSRDPDD